MILILRFYLTFVFTFDILHYQVKLNLANIPLIRLFIKINHNMQYPNKDLIIKLIKAISKQGLNYFRRFQNEINDKRKQKGSIT